MTMDTPITELTDEEYIAQTFAELDKLYPEVTDEQEPNDETVDGGEGVGEERSQDGQGQEEVGATGEGGEEGPSGDGSPDKGPQTVTLPNGQEFSLEEVQRYYDFEQWLKQHPDVAERVVQASRGGPETQSQQVAPLTEAPELPAELDLEDPQIKFLYEQNVATKRAMESLAKSQHEAQQHQAIEQANLAIHNVKDRLSLSDDQMGKLRVATAELNIVPTFIARNPSNPIGAMEQALEYTFWAQPEFRDAAIQARIDAENQSSSADRARQNKLNKVSNASGGSKPPPAKKEPATEDERREAMIAEISEAMGR